jgi:hypothetical protein
MARSFVVCYDKEDMEWAGHVAHVHFGGEAILEEDMRWKCIYFMWGTYCYGGKAMRKDITRKSRMLIVAVYPHF